MPAVLLYQQTMAQFLYMILFGPFPFVDDTDDSHERDDSDDDVDDDSDDDDDDVLCCQWCGC